MYLSKILAVTLTTLMVLLLACQGGTASYQPAGASTQDGSIFSVTPMMLETPDGAPLAAEWIRLLVPENRTRPEARMIELSLVRIRAEAENPGTPVIFLNGGPGDIPTTLQTLEQLAPLVDLFHGSSDVILLEQRGVGHSRPSLDCPGKYGLPFDRPGDHSAEVAAARSYFEECAKFWADQGVDLSGYNVREMAADVDDVRNALGYDRITLLGGSFGSHQIISVLKQFGDHVDRAVMLSIEGPNHSFKLPSVIQQHLEGLSKKIQADPELSRQIPDFLGLVQNILTILEDEPMLIEVTDPDTNEQVTVAVGSYDLQLITANALGRIELRGLPARYLEMSQGDFTWLGQLVLEHRRDSASNLMPLAVDCASGATIDRIAQIEREKDDTILGNAINGITFNICDVVGSPKPGQEFYSPLESDVPVLLINGDMDARTPVSNAEEVLGGLPNGQLVIVEGASHSLLQEAAPQIIPVIVQFITGDAMAPVAQPVIAAPFEFEAP